MGNTDERLGNTDEVEAHGLTGAPTDAPAAARDTEEGDDVEAHGMIGAPTDAPTD